MISAEEIKALMAKDENGLLPCPSCDKSEFVHPMGGIYWEGKYEYR